MLVLVSGKFYRGSPSLLYDRKNKARGAKLFFTGVKKEWPSFTPSSFSLSRKKELFFNPSHRPVTWYILIVFQDCSFVNLRLKKQQNKETNQPSDQSQKYIHVTSQSSMEAVSAKHGKTTLYFCFRVTIMLVHVLYNVSGVPIFKGVDEILVYDHSNESESYWV